MDANAHALSQSFDAWWYRRRYPLHGPRASSLRRARALSAADRCGEEPPLPAELLAPTAVEARGSGRFLGVYGADGVLRALDEHGLLARLARRGFTQVGVELDLRDPFEHALRLYDREPSRRLGELVAARRAVESVGPIATPGAEVIEILWLAIENPDAEGAPLPGQERPGLGLGPAVIDMTLAGATRLGFAGVRAVPAHYHLAWMYHPWFRPLDPADEGTLLALQRATRPLSRREASWAIARGEVSRDGDPWHWPGPTMCAPLDGRLRTWMTSSAYAAAAIEAATPERFALVR